MAGMAYQHAPRQGKAAAPKGQAKKPEQEGSLKERLHRLPQAAGIALLVLLLALSVPVGNYRALKNASPRDFAANREVVSIIEDRIDAAENILSVAGRCALSAADIDAARQAALDILQKQLYSDYMALSMEELTGGSLTNVAIETAMTNLNLKADRYEWQCFSFVQKVLRLLGVETEEIKFKRQTLVNRSETVADIGLMRDYIDQETALKLNPYIEQEEIPEIMERLAAENVTVAPVPNEPEEDVDA